MHVVEVRHAQQRRQHHADQPAFLVRMDRVVAAAERPAAARSRPADGRVEVFASDGPIPTRRTNGGRIDSEDAQSGHRHVLSERIRDEIDLVTERRQRANAMEFAERRAARLEERLRRDHQNAHRWVIFSRNRSTVRAALQHVQRTTCRAAGFGVRVLPIAAKLARQRRRCSRSSSHGWTSAGCWPSARSASIPWLLVALGLYAVTVAAATWRWHLLLDAQDVQRHPSTLLGSYLVANFFNNFLPSNIGGDVVRIRDTARPAGSKTLATTIVLVDRVLGLMGLVLVAALGATVAATAHGKPASPIWPSWLWAGFSPRWS